jgi:hypothetical protein
MANGTGGSSNVAIVAIVVLVLIVVGLLVYFLGFRGDTSSTVIQKPDINVERPSRP